MKKGNIIGEPFAEYVNEQIQQRQKVFGDGLNSQRDPRYTQYLNSRLSWVKMASSVIVNPNPTLNTDNEYLIKTNGDGTFRITNLGLNIDQFNGYKLASSAVLFNGLQQASNRDSFTKNGTETDENNTNIDPTISGKFQNWVRREGITKSTQLWNNAAYGLGGTDFGIQPMPGITSIDVKHLNIGSIRKATVTLRAHNKFQFELIETLYLRLGFTMLIEWGNSHYIDNDNRDVITVGNTLTEDFWFTDSSAGFSHLDMLKKIEEYRKKYDANYDGIFGKVNNFSWNLKNDGSYDITIELVSLGDLIESFTINTLPNPKPSTLSNENSQENQSTILNYLSDIRENFDSIRSEENKDFVNIKDFDYRTGITKFFEDTLNFDPSLFSEEKYNYFIRFGTFLNFIKNYVLIRYKNQDNEFPIIDIDTDIEANVMSIYPNQLSFDPRVCIIRSGYFSPRLKAAPGWFKSLEKFYDFNFTPAHGKIMNIYLNFDLVERIVKNNTDSKGNLSLYSCMKSICDELNRALGGVNNLEPIVYEERNTLIIMDQNSLPQDQRDELRRTLTEEQKRASYPLDLYGYNLKEGSSNFVKNFNFTTEITPNLANIITIGATSQGVVVGEDATAFSSWNKGLTDKFKQKLLTPPSLPLIKTPNTNKEKEKTKLSGPSYLSVGGALVKTEAGVQKDKDRKLLIESSFTEYLKSAFGRRTIEGGNTPSGEKTRYFSLDENFVQRGLKLFKGDFSARVQENKILTTTSTVGFLPIKLQIELEGLAGIKIYQKLVVNTDFLPKNYPEVLEFVVKGVNHKIQDNNWVTTIETISTPIIKELPILNELSSPTPNETAPPSGLTFNLPVDPNLPGALRIRNDDGGSGTFGAARENNKEHTGLDISTYINQPIYAPISGRVEITKATTKSTLPGVKIYGNGPYKGYTSFIFYIDPTIQGGQVIKEGTLIGTAMDLSKDYPEEVTDHIHFSIKKGNSYINPLYSLYKVGDEIKNGQTLFGKQGKFPLIG